MFDKTTKVLFAIWAALAIASFVCALFAHPFIVKLIGLIFGGLNLMIIGSLAISLIQGRRELRRQIKLLAEEKKED